MTLTAETKFELAGSRTVYKVILMAPKYPVHFDNKAEAEAFAKKRNRNVIETREPVWRRK